MNAQNYPVRYPHPPNTTKPLESQTLMQETMKQLPDLFRKSGFEFKLISREGDVALFEKFKPCITSTRLLEVVIVQKMGAHTWPDGTRTEAHEHMPW